jgi:peptidoglycan hydrolase-like protein with peptidoglycan-binding domain
MTQSCCHVKYQVAMLDSTTSLTASKGVYSTAVSSSRICNAARFRLNSSATKQPQLPSASPAVPFVFTENRHLGDTGTEIKLLQQFLNTHGFPLATSGPGSPGHETDKFGALTYKALKKFRRAHNPPATGYFGPLTRAAIQSL